MSHAWCRDSARGRHGTRHRESRGTRRRARHRWRTTHHHQVSPGTAVEALVNEGYLYSTIDEHYQATV